MSGIKKEISSRIDRAGPFSVQAVLCIFVFIAYIAVWPNEFLFNDGILITNDKFLREWSRLPDLLTHLSNAGYGLPGGFYRPVEMLIYFLVYQAFGPSTIAYHALNLGLHMLSACLFYQFGLRLGLRKGVVFAAALLWAVHPLHTTNVAYMSSTSELLWGALCLAGLLTLLPDFTSRKIWKAMIFFVPALGCKEPAVVFPALAAATFFFVGKDRFNISAYLRMWPLWMVSVCYIIGWTLFMHKTGYRVEDVGDPNYIHYPLHRFLTFLAALPVYLRLLFWPTGLHIEWIYPTFMTLFAWQPLAGLLVVGLSLWQILRARKSRRDLVLSFGLLWAAISLSPYSGIAAPVDAVLSEGWLYVPMMGLFLAGADSLAIFFEKKKFVASALVAVLALSLGFMTFVQVRVWRTPETLYEQNVRSQDWTRPEKRYLLGLFYLGRGDFEQSVEQFKDEVNNPDPGDMRLAQAHMWLALGLLHTHVQNNDVSEDALLKSLPLSSHIPEAIRELGTALRVDPGFAEAHKILAAIYRYQGNSQMADFHEKRAREIFQQRQSGSQLN